jgi:hypothetical protein
VDLYIHSPIHLHGVVLKFVEHRDNFTLHLTLDKKSYILKEVNSVREFSHILEDTKNKERTDKKSKRKYCGT